MKLDDLAALIESLRETSVYSFDPSHVKSGELDVRYVKLTAVFNAVGDMVISEVSLISGTDADYLEQDIKDALKNKASK